ncbi:hypothetical protein, partial [Allorhizobium ampelinum]|uniref:hypothetical protein n=1 Tax=Allorhizobium ampelinum TaxID=3025782 RepID=UPI001F444CE0
NKMLEQQADQYANAVDNLSNRLAEALRRLAPHDPDYVRGEAPGLVPSEGMDQPASPESNPEAS